MPKRKTTFNPEWTKEYGFISKSRKDDCHAYCTLCRCDVDVSSKGKGASTDKHKSNNQSAGTSSLFSFFREVTSPQDDKISAAELCKVYHTVKHHQSYRSVDCGIKVDREIYNNSTIAKGVTCGKTKAKALCENVLAPYSIHAHVDYIKENELHYSLATDASNKGTTKCFPIRYSIFTVTATRHRKYAAGNMDLDIENVVLKVYSHFSISASRTAQQREFCEFVEVDECNLLRHVITRWLSLLPSIDQMLKCWKPLTSYFQSLGVEECPKILWKCFAEDRTEVSEMYLIFLSHILKVFSDCIEALEAKSFGKTSVFKVMTELKGKLERLKDHFFGFAVNSRLKQLTPDLANKCEADFIQFYERAKKYVSERCLILFPLLRLKAYRMDVVISQLLFIYPRASQHTYYCSRL
uniref:Uncharacterized protein n=1 Tax=Gouania willdenowi TaxID=441366 RepID=A0A8C5GAZ7_GOUWI